MQRFPQARLLVLGDAEAELAGVAEAADQVRRDEALVTERVIAARARPQLEPDRDRARRDRQETEAGFGRILPFRFQADAGSSTG